MEIRVVDFELVTRHFRTYQEGLELVEIEKKFFLESLKPFKAEIQRIMIDNAKEVVPDRRLREQRNENFEKIQKEVVVLEKEYNEKIKKIHDAYTIKTFDELQVIITEWASQAGIDLVTSKMEVIFNSDKIDATNQVIDLLKQKDMFVDLESSEVATS
jgi:Skp family chaperone for outer membrane proteins